MKLKTFALEIEAVHPAGAKDPDYTTWELAEKLVHERHSKYEFVALVNWLLIERDKAFTAGVSEGRSPAG